MLLLLLASLIAIWFAWRDWQRATVTIEWSTASELDTVGFNLYRSETPVGAFERINPQVVPSAGDALTGSDYHYEDHDVHPGQTYFYKLEDVTANGLGEQHGPIAVKAQGHIGLPAAVAVFLIGMAAMVLVSGRAPHVSDE